MFANWTSLHNVWRNFASARRGNVAITFALATLPVIGAVGAAVDFSHANSVKAAMQAALDSTALMLSRDAATLSNADLQTKAMNYFKALFTRPEAKSITISATYTATSGSQVVVNGSAKVDTSLMAIAGYTQMTVNGSATSKWGSERLRVALALDNTGSMSDDGKMTALKSATKSLLTQLKAAASVNGDVYVSIIPFNKDVNVGSSNYNATWIDWEDWEDDNGHDSSTTTCTNSKTGKSGKSTKKCTTSTAWVPDNHNTWNGCITDRDQNYDQLVTAPTGSSSDNPTKLFPAEEYDSCPIAMKGLSYDWTSMNSLVDSMQPNGNTNQGIGLVWAWQSLVGGGPLTAPAKDSNYTYKDIIILMSDGLNTENRFSTSQSTIDKRMYNASSNGSGTCANIKNSGVTIYTVQVNTAGDPTSAIMQNCAGSPDKMIDPDKFFMVTSANNLGTVFSAIGTNLTKLRVAK
jgi:Flp pilus assembly protein TadG